MLVCRPPPEGAYPARDAYFYAAVARSPCPPSRFKRHRDEQDLSYLETSDREGENQSHVKEDLEHIAKVEAQIQRHAEINAALLAELQNLGAKVLQVHTQNESVKRMFHALNVTKDAFNMGDATDEPSRKRRMIEIGTKLVKNLSEPKEQQPPQLKSHPLPPRPRGRPPLNATTQTPAPTVAAAARPVFTPPASYPVESQIAAASLTLSQGDPAVALLSLLEKALAARAPQSQSQNGSGSQAQMPPPPPVAVAAVEAVE